MADKYNVFANTKSNWNNLSETVDVTQWSNPWGASTPEWQGFPTVDTDALATEGKNLVAFGISSLDIIGSDFATLALGDPRAIIETTDAAAGAAIGFLNQKLERIKTAWETPVEVTIKALIGEIAPYCSGDLSTVSLKMVDILKNVTNELLGTNGETWEDIAADLGTQAFSYITSDAKFVESASNLAAVKIFADSMQTVMGGITAVKKVLRILEPISPLLETAYLMVASWCTGGASAVSATNKTSEIVEDTIQRLLSIAAKCARQYVYNIKIKIPSLLVNAYKSSGISIKSYVKASWEGLQAKSSNMSDTDRDMLMSIFSDEYYDSQFANPQWKKQINKMLNTAQKAMKIPGWANNSSDKWSRYFSTAVAGVANAAVSRARRVSYVPDYNKVIWSDPTTWYTNAQVAWTREQNYTHKYWENIGSLSDYEEVADIFDSEGNPIRSSSDIQVISGKLLGSDFYGQWQDELAKDEGEEQ